MKNIAALLLISILLSACLPAASLSTPIGEITPSVLAVETFLADIAQNVAGNRLKVESLIPVGLDPHAYEPTPQDIAKIADSQVLIVNGGGFETWLEHILANAGTQSRVIEAAAGLTSRASREGETTVMSDADWSDAMCASAGESQAQGAKAGVERSAAQLLPSGSGLFRVQLSQSADSTFAGFLMAATDEAGDFQIVTSAGNVNILDANTSVELEAEKTLPLDCQGLATGRIVELEKDKQYLLELTGFAQMEALLLVGPAGGHHHQGDPHFWLDPNLVIRYVENIRDGLIQADPQGKDIYTENAAAYTSQLKELDGWIVEQVKQIPAERRLLVTNHESLGYFADRYGFKIVGTILPSVSTGASPSAQQLARLIDRIKATGAPAIFLETGSSTQLPAQVAQETGVKVVTDLYSHSVTAPGGDAPTYIAMMKSNVNAIVAALR